MRLKCTVREEPVISERDAHARKGEKYEEEHDLEPVETVVPDVERYRGESEQEGTDEKNTRRPVDTVGGNSEDHRIGGGLNRAALRRDANAEGRAMSDGR